jgi:hypothetical protein
MAFGLLQSACCSWDQQLRDLGGIVSQQVHMPRAVVAPVLVAREANTCPHSNARTEPSYDAHTVPALA